MSNIKLINGDMLKELDKMEENSIDSIVCDPPCHMTQKRGDKKGFMGKEWDGGGIAFTVDTWQKCLRVLKPGGYMMCFGAPRTSHRMTVAIEDAGFQIRDCCMYMFGSGFPKSHSISLAMDKLEGHSNRGHAISSGNQIHPTTGKKRANGENLDRYVPKTELGKKWDGWGTGMLKPAYEPIIVARKPLSEGSISKNIAKWGTGGHNVDACRIGCSDVPSAGRRTKNCHSSEETVSGGNGTPVYEAHNLGRFPANVILECTCDEVIPGEKGEVKKSVVKNNMDTRNIGCMDSENNFMTSYNDTGDTHTNPDCPCYILDQQGPKSKPKKSRVGKRPKGNNPYHSNDVLKDNASCYWPGDNGGGVSRFFYTSKPNKREKNAGLDSLPIKNRDLRTSKGKGSFEKKGLQPMRNSHPTVKPIDLMEYLIKLVTPTDGVCLDCFMGSGTTAIAAQNLGFDFVGIEMEEEYFIIAKKRLKYWKEKLNDRTVDLFK